MGNLPIPCLPIHCKGNLHNVTWTWLFHNAYNALTWNGKWMDTSKHELQKSSFWIFYVWQLKTLWKFLTQSTNICCMKLGYVVWTLKKFLGISLPRFGEVLMHDSSTCQGTRHDRTMQHFPRKWILYATIQLFLQYSFDKRCFIVISKLCPYCSHLEWINQT